MVAFAKSYGVPREVKNGKSQEDIKGLSFTLQKM